MIDLWNNRNWQVMLLKELNEPFDSDDYLYEIKFDGIRCVCFASSSSVTLISRNRKDITYLFPELQKIKNLVNSNVIFDGEIIVISNGVPSFSKLGERLHLKNEKNILSSSFSNPVVFVAFDIIYEDKNLVNKSLIERKSILDNYSENDVFIKSAVFGQGVKLFKEIKKKGLEGIVAKLKSGTYHINSRTDDFIKIKNVKEKIFYVGGYIDKNDSYVFSLILCEKVHNRFNYVGKVSVSKKDSIYNLLLREKQVDNYFDECVDAVFVMPTIKCNVEYLERTDNGNLRHPVFKGVIK